MRRTVSLLLTAGMIFALAACGQSAVSEKREEMIPAVQKTDEQSEASQYRGESENQETSGLKIQEQQTGKQSNTEMEEQAEAVSTGGQAADVNTKTLVVYFSCTGSTKPLAEYAAESLDADLYEIVPEDLYTEKDLAYYTNGRADQEQNDPNVRPAISGSVENMDEYDTIILGYPIWHGQAPRIISTFLESYDFSEKTILPFCTSHSSGMGSSADNLHALCSDSVIWLDGKRFEVGTSKESVQNWIGEMGIE